MDKLQLISEVENTLNGFINLFSMLTDEKINTGITGKNWTAGELGQHVVLSTQLFAQGKTEGSARPYDLWVNDIKEVFTNQEKKALAAPFLVPEKKNYQRNEIIDALHRHRDAHTGNIQKADLTALVSDIELPVWGLLSVYEWTMLMIYHVQRHTEQLKQYL